MRKLAKRMLAILITAIMIFSVMAVGMTSVGAVNYFPEGLAIFFKPTSKWIAEDSTIYAHILGASNLWFPMEDVDADGYYKCEVPYAGNSGVQFASVKNSVTDVKNENATYLSASLLYDGKNNCYTLGSTDTKGTWSYKEDTWIYFTNDAGWNAVRAYCSTPSKGKTNGGWPGVATTLLNEKYSIYGINAQDFEYIFFTNANDGYCTKRRKVSELIGKCTNAITDEVYNSALMSYSKAKQSIENGNGFVPKKLPTVALAGSFNDWSKTKNLFSNDPGCNYVCSIDLEPGTYSFKLVYNDLWYGCNNANITNFTSSDITLAPTGSDIVLKSTGGTFRFTYNTTDQRLTVTFTDDGVPGKNIYLTGAFNDWALDKAMEPVPTSKSYYKACSSSHTSLNGALESIGVDYSKEYRMEIALANGISDYEYTAEQNTKMLELLKKGKLIDPEMLTSVYKTMKLSEGSYDFYINKNGARYSTTSQSINDYTTSKVSFYYNYAPLTHFHATGAEYTFYYNWEKDTMTVTAKYDVDPAEKAKVSLSGTFNSWTTDKNMKKLDAERVSKTIDLKPGTYEFKIVHNDRWFSSYPIISDSTSEWGIIVGVLDQNLTFEATGGTYTFIYNVVTRVLVVTYDKKNIDVDVCLAGDFNNWSKTANKMVKSTADGNVVETTLQLEKGSYYFKIVKDQFWYGNGTSFTNGISNLKLSYTGDNCTVRSTGTGTFTFKYNVIEDTLTVTSKVEEQDIADIYSVRLAGEFNSWSSTKTPMTKTSQNTVATTVTLKPGTYPFKIVKDDFWYGNGATFSDTTKDAQLSYTGGNCELKATGGDYTFTYNVALDTLTITAKIDEKDPADLYSVNLAGSFNDWSTSKTKMTKASAETVSVKVSLQAGSYPFKIVKDNFWYGNGKSFSNTTSETALSYTGGDCYLVATGGDYTFTFNVVTNKLKITYVPSKDDFAVNATAALSGDFNSWSTSANKFTYHSTNKLAITVPLEYGTYQFKVVYDSLWYGNSQPINDKTSSDLSLTSTSTECILNAQGGNYTFIFDVVTKKLKVTAQIVEKDYAKDAVVSVSGEFNGWSTDVNVMGYSDKTTVATTFVIPAGSYQFKIVHDGMWYGNSTEIHNSTSFSGALKMDILDSECKIHAKGGKYTFIYNVLEHTLEVIHVEEEIDYTKDAKVYLAGDFNDWNRYTTPMTAISTKEVSVDVYLVAGEYNFKVVNNDVWFGNSGAVITDTIDRLPTSNTATNILLKATKAGTYTFTYNVINDNIGISFTASDTAQSASVNISGEFNDWSENEALTYEGSGIFTVTKKLSAGTYGFKIINDGLWYGNNGTIENTTTSSSDIGWAMSISAGDCTLEAKGGSYTFKYNVNTNFLQVIYNG